MRELLALFDHGWLTCGGAPVAFGQTGPLDAALDASPLRTGDRLTIRGAQGPAAVGAIVAAWRRGLLPVVHGAEARGTEPDAIWSWADGPLELCGSRGAIEDRAIVHATSGSTGPARQAGRSAGSLKREARGYVSAYGLAAGERVAIWAPVTHSFAWGAMLGALSAGCTVEIVTGFHPRQLARALEEGSCAVHILTPQMLHLALPRVTAMRKPPRAIVAGAGAVTPDLNALARATLGIAVGRNYGSSETGATLGVQARDDDAVGYPLCGVTIIAPEPGESGELVLEIEDVAAPHRTRRFTGDIARRGADGAVTILGRTDHLVKINGHTFDCARIAEIAKAQLGVTDAAVLALARPGEPGISDIYVAAAGGGLDARRLQRLLLEAVPALRASLRLRICESLPRDAMGKLPAEKLREILSRTEDGDHAHPR